MTELPYLKVRATITEHAEIVGEEGQNRESTTRLTVISAMAHHRLRTDVFGEDGAPVLTITFDGERIQEYRHAQQPEPGRASEAPHISYEAPHDYGGENVHLVSSEMGCRFGVHLGTWIGPNTHMERALSNLIDRSESIERVRLSDRGDQEVFKIVRVRRTDDPETGLPEEFREILLLDRDTLLPLEFTGTQSGAWGSITRRRVYDILESGEVPAAIEWTIDPKKRDIQRLTAADTKKEVVTREPR